MTFGSTEFGKRCPRLLSLNGYSLELSKFQRSCSYRFCPPGSPKFQCLLVLYIIPCIMHLSLVKDGQRLDGQLRFVSLHCIVRCTFHIDFSTVISRMHDKIVHSFSHYNGFIQSADAALFSVLLYRVSQKDVNHRLS